MPRARKNLNDMEPIKVYNDVEEVEGYVARDFSGEIWLYENHPSLHVVSWSGRVITKLDREMFPEVTWESEPKKVRLSKSITYYLL